MIAAGGVPLETTDAPVVAGLDPTKQQCKRLSGQDPRQNVEAWPTCMTPS